MTLPMRDTCKWHKSHYHMNRRKYILVKSFLPIILDKIHLTTNKATNEENSSQDSITDNGPERNQIIILGTALC